MTTKTLQPALKKAIEKVAGAGVSLSEVLSDIAPAPEKVPAPSVAPLPTEISEAEHQALTKVSEVYGQVVPQERRALTQEEASKLLDERDTLKTLEKMAKRRVDDIRTTVFNHLDTLVEDAGIGDEADRDKDGHYVVEGEVLAEDQPTKFVRQVSQRSPSLDAQKLKDLVDDPDVDFTHQDYLAMTTQVRVVDENKIMLELKKNPELLRAIQKATNPGGKVAALYQRKR